MKKLLSIILFVFAAFSAANAIIVQKVILNDGSEYSGYIQQQDGYGKITFRSYQAIVNLKNGNNTNSITEANYNISTLSDAWVKWAEANDAFVGVGENRSLVLSDISNKSKTIYKVRVLERGTTIKYLEQTPNTYSLSWKDIKVIKGEKRKKTALSGINRAYQLKNGQTFEGEYAEETDSTISLYLKSGVVQSFKMKDVAKCTMLGINPHQDIFQQSELLDIIKTASSEIKGIIIEQNYEGKTDKDKYFLVKQENSAIASVKLADIIELRKVENDKYAPKFDVLLKDGEVMLNRAAAKFAKVNEQNGTLLVDSLVSKAVVIKQDQQGKAKLTLEYKSSTGANVEAYKLVKLTKNVGKKNVVTYSFSYKDLVDSVLSPASVETSVNYTTKAEYVVDRKGEYVFYDSKQKRVIPIIVQ